MNIRRFTPNDAEQIARLFHDTIHAVNYPDYSPRQLAAWALDDIHFQDWLTFCSDRMTYVVDDKGTIAGFANLELNGHIDCFYCHKNYQRRGVGTRLYHALEEKALELGCDRVFTEASITAQPFFQRMGFATLQAQTVICRGETFTNFRMEKVLNPAPRLTQGCKSL